VACRPLAARGRKRLRSSRAGRTGDRFRLRAVPARSRYHVVGSNGSSGAVSRRTVEHGALARAAVAELVDTERVPAATLLVNVTGSFLLGAVTSAGVGGDSLLFVGTGACGAFTTFSSFAFETVRLGEEGRVGAAAAYAFGTFALAAAAVLAGTAVV
jgi:CrcB protein